MKRFVKWILPSTRESNGLQKSALWAYLRSLEPLQFGDR